MSAFVLNTFADLLAVLKQHGFMEFRFVFLDVNGRVSAYSWCEQWNGTAWNIVGAEITKNTDIQFGISLSLAAEGLWILCNNGWYYHLNVVSISCV